MKNKIIALIICLCSLTALVIDMKLFWNMAVFVDEANTSPSVVLGGDLWLYMAWLKFGLLLAMCILAGIELIRGNQTKK